MGLGGKEKVGPAWKNRGHLSLGNRRQFYQMGGKGKGIGNGGRIKKRKMSYKTSGMEWKGEGPFREEKKQQVAEHRPCCM